MDMSKYVQVRTPSFGEIRNGERDSRGCSPVLMLGELPSWHIVLKRQPLKKLKLCTLSRLWLVLQE
jgi:hypothetical protein